MEILTEKEKERYCTGCEHLVLKKGYCKKCRYKLNKEWNKWTRSVECLQSEWREENDEF